MSVTVNSVTKGSAAYKAGLRAGDILVSIDGNEIMDVLDYRFYQNNDRLTLEFINKKGKIKVKKVKKKEYEELGLLFETYLMDKKHSCKNKCVFCFIDQLPKGLRETLYFKDDDSRLSFLFGNYITLTNITEHEIDRIIKMHISPINISVHTTNPKLRVKMMNNKNAGKVLEIINRFNDAGIKLNCQLVLCPDFNDDAELERSLEDLIKLENVESVAAVPVGLTKYRDGLVELRPFTKDEAKKTIQTIDRYAMAAHAKYGDFRVFAADEFYLKAELPIPKYEYYGEFPQLENGVGLMASFESEIDEALRDIDYKLEKKRIITVVTGEAAYDFISQMVDKIKNKWDNLECRVRPIKNNFFGGYIDVAGLVTATDIIEQLKGEDFGDEVLIPSVMLRDGGDMFLDSITLTELAQALDTKVILTDTHGWDFIEKLLGI